MCVSVRDARAGARKNVRCVGRKSRERSADAPKVVREWNRRRGRPGANFEHLAEAPFGMSYSLRDLAGAEMARASGRGKKFGGHLRAPAVG